MSYRNRPLAVAGLLLLATGCGGSLLDVQNPDVTKPTDVKGETGATALYEGARSEFIAAHDGDGSATALPASIGLVYLTGLLTDEFLFPATPPDLISIDRRDIQRTNGTVGTAYLVLHRARIAAGRAASALAALPAAARDPRVGESLALEAMTYLLFGEAFCGGVPFSSVSEGVITPGSPISTVQMLTEALNRFDAALPKAAGDPEIVNFIRVAKGRTLLNLGRFSEAGAAAAAVPTSYRYENAHSTADPRSGNNIKNLMWDTYFLGMSNNEGTNGLDFVTAGDHRVEAVPGGISQFDLETEVYRFKNYESGAAPILLASGVEARLIEAEAALRAGNAGGWLAKINTARAESGLDPEVDPGTAAGRVFLLFRERAFALYGTAHRLGDLRRLVRQYSRGAEAVFPTGAYHKDNLVRATQVALPVPQTEENNTNYKASDCDPTKA